MLLVLLACCGPTTLAEEALRIEIHKEDRRLVLLRGDALVVEHPIGLGFSPTGHKQREGDGATPEGRYRVCVKNPQSQYYLSLGINYPNSEDADRGLERGQITADQAAAIRRAERRGVCPPWNTALGGTIYIHGRGASSDWTLGCVALDDPPMRRLFDTVPVGTEVSIYP
ncbi:MAG: L,D-transpeptidase family protein [Acidobacteriota bacterium]